jgi:octaprenyl-diphosphate synthase
MLHSQKIDLKEIVSPILPYLNQVDNYIKEFISAELGNLDKGARQVFKKPGKKVRASFVLLGAALAHSYLNQDKSKKNDLSPVKNAVPLGAGVELVHAATLIHDDIIDNASFRRGMETVSRRWDSKVAVLVGDWLFTRGLDIAAMEKNSAILPCLIHATREMVKGELAQMEYSSIKKINRQRYLNIISAKTAGFLAACIKVGALNQALREDLAQKLYQFGYLCGLGFQITDDAMDFSNKRITGKDQANDFLDGKVTLPVIILLAKSTRIKKEVESLYQERNLDKFQRLKDLVAEHDTLSIALSEAREYVNQGLMKLESFDDNNKKILENKHHPLNILKELVKFFIEREY